MPSPIQIADSLEPELRDGFLAMIEVIKLTVPDSVLVDLLERRDITGIINEFERAVGAYAQFRSVTSIYSTYGELVHRSLRSVFASGSFELVSQLVVDRVSQTAGRLIVGVGADTVTGVREILISGYLDGIGARAAARQIRSVVGLLPAHAAAVGRYSQALADAGHPEVRRTQLTETYARRLLAYRADNIARTETISASHAGMVAGWVAQADQGILQRHRTVMEWMVTEDDRLCPWCAPMDGQQVELGAFFSSTHKGFPEGKPENRGPGSKRRDRTTLRPDPRSQPRDELGRFTRLVKRDARDELDGLLVELKRPKAVPHPPLHPQCRCTMVLRFTD